jgi:hypothetical protein
MEAARKRGRYHVLYYIRALADSKKFKGRYCNYWPEIHEFRRDGESMGAMVPTRPNKVMRLLETKPDRYMWYQDTIDLFSARIYGPFDFMEDHKIPTHFKYTSITSSKSSPWINKIRKTRTPAATRFAT